MKNYQIIKAVTLLSFASIIIYSCADEPLFDSEVENDNPTNIGNVNTSFPNVDQRLWVYFERFENEGKARGYNTDLVDGGVTGSFADLENGVAGSCTYTSDHSIHHVTIDNEFWNGFSENVRELIVFHELGHCYLHRDHNESQYSNGVCRSIMRSGLGGCLDNYNASTRDTYLDELFNNN